MSRSITHAKNIQFKSRRHAVKQIGPNWYKVKSAVTNRSYDVVLAVNGGTCTCHWGQQRPDDDHRSACSHVVAALNYRAAKKGRRVYAWASEEAARRQHRPMLKIGDGLILTSRAK
jgi:hypothetical protein